LPAKPGMSYMDMMETCEVLYLIGANPMASAPDTGRVAELLASRGFVVVQDIFLTETARLADVVLPASSYVEREGTVTNSERRVQKMHKVLDELPGTRPDWEILCDLAGRMGAEMQYDSVRQIMSEIASLTPQYGGISYERLDRGDELCWPCPTPDHPGTPVLHRDKFTRGLGKFHAIDYLPADEQPDKSYPLILTTGRLAAHFHTGTMTRKSAGLEALAPKPYVEIHPGDASGLGIQDGDPVKVSSRRGSIELMAKVDLRVDLGVIFIPFHYAEAAANVLTNPARDPIAKIPEYKVCAARVEKLA